MNYIKNTMGITEISAKKNIKAFCPIGKSWYTGEVTVSFLPADKICDYCDADKKLLALDGKELIIEEMAKRVYQIFEEINPKWIRVDIKVNDAAHFPVKITKFGVCNQEV
ncbi:hypothetical protein [Eubacterium maltosivorans]|uniref:hypothetical protein n=1 Tax=Eubacterium maltosivorans TaxID=2041044 RepID=UPI0018A0E26A|nr:hypothetical protein [Eubacterium maltosivorans]